MVKSKPNHPTTRKISSPFLFSHATFHLLVDQITDYAIFLLTPTGEVVDFQRTLLLCRQLCGIL